MNILLTALKENLVYWPKGTDFAINSKYSEEVSFYREGADWMHEDPPHSEYVVDSADPGAYHVVTREEWEEVRS